MDQIHLDDLIHKTVRETLFQIGIIVENNDDVVQFREDMMHLRKWRKAVENIQNKSVTATVGMLVTGFFAALLLAAQAFFGHHQG